MSNIVVEPLDARDGCIAVGEKIELEVRLNNLSGYQNERPIQFVVDDELVHETDAVLEGGDTGDLIYTMWFDSPGEYHINIGGSETADIEEPKPSNRSYERSDPEPTNAGESVPVNVRATEIFGPAGDFDVDDSSTADSKGATGRECNWA